MRNIKYFKYRNTYKFEHFLSNNRYWEEDVKGFKFGWKEQYHGNILKVYTIYFNDGEYKLFRVVYFKSFKEYNQSRLALINNKLLMWYDSANVIEYKSKDIYGIKDEYVIVS